MRLHQVMAFRATAAPIWFTADSVGRSAIAVAVPVFERAAKGVAVHLVEVVDEAQRIRRTAIVGGLIGRALVLFFLCRHMASSFADESAWGFR